MALTSTRVAVEFFRIQSVGGASLSSVIARPTTNRITSVAEHGFVDLPDKVEAVPQVSTGYGVLLLDATDQAGVSESFGWQIGLVGEYGSLTLAVPSAPGGGRTVTVGGTSYPAVWLTDLADFSAADGSLPLSSFFTKSEVDAKFAALPFRSDNTTLTGAAVGGLLAVAAVSGAAVTGWEVIPTAEITPADIGAQPADADLTAIAALAPANDDFVQRKAGAWANRTVAQVKTDLGVAGWKSPAAGRYFLPISQGSGSTGTLTNNWLRVLPWIVRGTITIDRMVGDIATAGEVGSKFRMGIYADDGGSRPGALVVDAGQIAADSATVQELAIAPVTLQPGVYWLGGAVQLAPTTQPSVRVVNGATPDVPMILGTALPAAGASGTAYAATGVTDVLPVTFPVNPAAVSTGPRLFLRAA